jgi:hypothetical protein
MCDQAPETAIELRIPLIPVVSPGDDVELEGKVALLQASGKVPI